MAKKISVTALFSAFAIILSYVETFIPSVGIPGAKIGLANFAIILALYLMGAKYAIIINFVRILIVGFLFGNAISICFALSGAILSMITMVLLKKTNRLSIVTVSICAGVSHNIGQIIVALFLVKTYNILYYAPVLIISGIISGLIIGILAKIVYKRTKLILKKIGV